MSSNSNNHQHPPSTSAGDLSTTQSANSSNIDATASLSTAGYAHETQQLEDLVQAANAAQRQDVDWTAVAAAASGATGNQHHLDGYGPDMHIEDDGFDAAGFGAGLGARHLRSAGAGSNGEGALSGLSRTVSKKRKRGDDPLDPALTAVVGLDAGQQHASHGQQHGAQPYDGEGLDIRPVPAQSLSDARAGELHSAAALFRQPSSNRKHTRPPMSKLFVSLELSPENFLQLQAAAKAYMLDDSHPERRECVGQRGKGDTEMVKLRLWNCVRHFLESEGHGERYFGENSVNEGVAQRTYVWPRDQHRIISLIIPLLRRMVTNERQRQYAIEARKGGGPEERRRRKTEESFPNTSVSPPRYSDELKIHPHHHAQPPTIPEEIAPPQPAQPSADHAQVGLTDLFHEGYPTDWENVTRTYDWYNRGLQLDHLWALSGLAQPDFRGLVAAIDSHYQGEHQGDFECPKPCEDENIRRILEAGSMSALQWRVGGAHTSSAGNHYAHAITHDISRIIRDSLAVKHGAHPPSYDHHPALPFYLSDGHPNPNTPHSPILRVNLVQNGRRIFSRFDLLAEQCPDLGTVKQIVVHRFAGQVPGLSESTLLRVKVLVPDGLTTVKSDGEWTIALLSAATVDWMDGDLKVVVEVDGA